MNIDEIIPNQKVIEDASQFLNECNWKLEIEEKVLSIPKDVELRIQTKAYIQAIAPNIFLGNHYEAVVIIGCDIKSEHWIAKYGYLKMYYDLKGVFISEDRYHKFSG